MVTLSIEFVLETSTERIMLRMMLSIFSIFSEMFQKTRKFTNYIVHSISLNSVWWHHNIKYNGKTNNRLS